MRLSRRGFQIGSFSNLNGNLENEEGYNKLHSIDHIQNSSHFLVKLICLRDYLYSSALPKSVLGYHISVVS